MALLTKEVNVDTYVDVHFDIDVDEYFENMDDYEKEDMLQLLNKDVIFDLILDEKFLKELAYHLKFTNSDNLELLKNELKF